MAAESFAQQYQYFLNKIKWLSVVGNNPITYQIAAWLATKHSPFCADTNLIEENLQKTLYLPEITLKKTSLEAIKLHGVFCINAFFFRKMTSRWVKNHISIKNNTAFTKLLNYSNGGLFLSYHHHFQHLLVSLLGIYQKNPSFVAMSPDSSPFYNLLKPNIDYLHQNTEFHFGEGKYIFIDPLNSKKAVRKEIYQALEKNNWIYSLHDNMALNSKNSHNIQIFNRIITVLAGTVDIALEMNKPIFCGLLEWKDGTQFEFDLIELNTSNGIVGILTDYFQFLEQKVKHNPALWEGWQWFQDCPEIKGNI